MTENGIVKKIIADNYYLSYFCPLFEWQKGPPNSRPSY